MKEEKKDLLNETPDGREEAYARDETEQKFEPDGHEETFVPNEPENNSESPEPEANSEPSESEENLRSEELAQDAPDTESGTTENAPEDAISIGGGSASLPRKKRLKPWSELTKKEKTNRVLAVAMSVILIGLLTFVTVWCCVIAEKSYKEPQWVSEREVYRENVVDWMDEKGNGLKVPTNAFGENRRYFLTTKERYDMRYTLYPTNENLAGYRIMFLETDRAATESQVMICNIYGYVDESGMLDEEDGDPVRLGYWTFTARERVSSKMDDNGVVYALYTLKAVIGGHLYAYTAEIQAPDGAFTAGGLDFARQIGNQVMSNLNEINL